jgi:hypothetical protein
MSAQTITGGVIEDAVHNIMRFKTETRTLAGNVVLTTKSPTVQVMDPTAARSVTLPAEADSAGLMFVIINTADAAEIITVQDDTPATVVTPTQAEAAIVWCDGVAWYGMVGAFA